MTEQEKRDLAIEIAKSYLGTWYIWGGDDPSGFDCSGFMVEILKSIGILPRKGDWTAHMLAASMNWPLISAPHNQGGDLVFWYGHDSAKVIHVEMAINGELSIGASGGGSKTLTREDAVAQNAFIKIRPIKSRPKIWGYVSPY